MQLTDITLKDEAMSPLNKELSFLLFAIKILDSSSSGFLIQDANPLHVSIHLDHISLSSGARRIMMSRRFHPFPLEL